MEGSGPAAPCPLPSLCGQGQQQQPGQARPPPALLPLVLLDQQASDRQVTSS
jgi:hypothetical protein